MTTTQVMDLASGPVELHALVGAGGLFVQNIGTTRVYYGELAMAPDLQDDGIVLPPCAGMTVGIELFVDAQPRGYYVWARRTGKVAITRAVVPT